MPCYHPLTGFKAAAINPDTGKRAIVFNPLKAIDSTTPISLPCNNCIGCRLARSEDWAVRCMHEAQMHEANSFITLTYDKEHLPEDYSVSVREFQLFMKRLRSDVTVPLRYFACGEYGSETLRPHYHALLNGTDFRADRELLRKSDFGPIYTSAQLSKAWPYGLAEFGAVTFKSARYCAGYNMKKVGGDRAADHYTRVHPDSGRIVSVEPEFCLQSRRPGIGSTWFDKFHADCFPSDFLIVEGRHVPVPKFYLRKLEELEQEKIKRRRKRASIIPARKWDRTRERLAVREFIKNSRIIRLQRPL